MSLNREKGLNTQSEKDYLKDNDMSVLKDQLKGDLKLLEGLVIRNFHEENRDKISPDAISMIKSTVGDTRYNELLAVKSPTGTEGIAAMQILGIECVKQFKAMGKNYIVEKHLQEGFIKSKAVDGIMGPNTLSLLQDIAAWNGGAGKLAPVLSEDGKGRNGVVNQQLVDKMIAICEQNASVEDIKPKEADDKKKEADSPTTKQPETEPVLAAVTEDELTKILAMVVDARENLNLSPIDVESLIIGELQDLKKDSPENRKVITEAIVDLYNNEQNPLTEEELQKLNKDGKKVADEPKKVNDDEPKKVNDDEPKKVNDDEPKKVNDDEPKKVNDDEPKKVNDDEPKKVNDDEPKKVNDDEPKKIGEEPKKVVEEPKKPTEEPKKESDNAQQDKSIELQGEYIMDIDVVKNLFVSKKIELSGVTLDNLKFILKRSPDKPGDDRKLTFFKLLSDKNGTLDKAQSFLGMDRKQSDIMRKSRGDNKIDIITLLNLEKSNWKNFNDSQLLKDNPVLALEYEDLFGIIKELPQMNPTMRDVYLIASSEGGKVAYYGDILFQRGIKVPSKVPAMKGQELRANFIKSPLCQNDCYTDTKNLDASGNPIEKNGIEKYTALLQTFESISLLPANIIDAWLRVSYEDLSRNGKLFTQRFDKPKAQDVVALKNNDKERERYYAVKDEKQSYIFNENHQFLEVIANADISKKYNNKDKFNKVKIISLN